MNKNLIPLVLDSEYGLSQVITKAVKEIFNKVFVEHDQTKFKHLLITIKPDILFLNLDISQRVETFNLVEDLSKLQKFPMVYGILSEIDPELVAHAVENGFLHVFVGSVETLSVFKVINGHLKENEALLRDLVSYELLPPFTAEIELDFDLIQVDENGFKIRGPHYISKGTFFDFNANFVKEIFGVDSVPVMVTKTSQSENGDNYDIFIEVKENLEKNSMALRRYILDKK